MSVNAPYDDLDPMPFGKFKGECLQDIPASYLHWLWSTRPLNDRRLEAYIEKNIHALKKEYPDGIWS